jgi:hypothetical protein
MRIDEILNDSVEAMTKNGADKPINPKHSLTRTLTMVSGTVKGWGEQYSYCNERNIFQTLDRAIDKKLRSYLGRYRDIRSSTSDTDAQRRLLGVSLLADSNMKMIK